MTETTIFDIEKMGAGMWYVLHKNSMNAKTKQEQTVLIKEIRDLSDNFPCADCGQHFKQYLKRNPPERYLDIKGPDGMTGIAQWLIDFHNAVNIRTSKKTLDYTTAYNLYNGGVEICNIGCDKGKHSDPSVRDKSVDRFGDKSVDRFGDKSVDLRNDKARTKNSVTFRDLSYIMPGVITPVLSSNIRSKR